jgi:hypothetical protein
MLLVLALPRQVQEWTLLIFGGDVALSVASKFHPGNLKGGLLLSVRYSEIPGSLMMPPPTSASLAALVRVARGS